MAPKQRTAFITARKGFCYVTLKIGGQNFHILRIRKYTLDAEDKRDLRRRYPDVVFDWKKIGKQLAEKREACRYYRWRRQSSPAPVRAREPLYGYAVYDPITRTVYADEAAADGAPLLDGILCLDRITGLPLWPYVRPAPSEPRTEAKPRLELVSSSSHPKPRNRPR
jgi:hypothetical protein